MARHNVGHHKIPRIYLEAFTDPNGNVWIIDQNRKLYPQKPINVLTERDYYMVRFKTGGGTLNVETRFLGGIETTYSLIYKEVLEKRMPVSKENKAKLSIFIAAMMQRQPMVRTSLEKFSIDLERKVTAMRALSDDAKKRLAAMPSLSSRESGIPADKVLERLKDVGSLHTSLIPPIVVEIAPIIFDMKWAFIIRPNKSEIFITSDNPCVMVDPVGEAKFGLGTFGAAPGLIKKDIELTLPLSSTMALICGWKLNSDCNYTEVEENMVKNINARTKRYAQNIIASDKKFLTEILERIKK